MADNHIKFPTPDNADGNTITPGNVPFNPEDIFPDLGNEKLVKAMEALKKNETKGTQTALIEHALGARFFAPVDVIGSDGKLLQGNGKIEIPKDSKFNFKLIQNAKGEQYLAVFTDIKEFMKWSKTPKVNTIIVVFPQIAQLAAQKKDTISGFVINPMGQNIIFSQDAIDRIIEAMKTVAEKEKMRREAAPAPQVKLMFGKPTNIPDAVYGAFRKKLAKIPEVNEAYFCMLKQGEQEYYLFTLDINADNDKCREIGDSVCSSAKLFLTKYPIMAAPVDSPFGEGAKKVESPFYTKEE